MDGNVGFEQENEDNKSIGSLRRKTMEKAAVQGRRKK
jgi:hypothetical protein